MLQQKGEGIVDRFGIDYVVVVEHENKIVRNGSNLVDQDRQDCFGRQWLWGVEHTRYAFPDIDRLQSGDEVSHKACRVAVPVIQRKPGGRSPATSDPFAEERGLAKAGGGGDEGQPAVQTLVEAFDQAWARDGPRLRRWDVQFGG